MKRIIILVTIILTMILTPVYVNGVEDVVGLNWYDYNTGNETRNDFKVIETSNGTEYNASIAYSQYIEDSNMWNFTWYYDDTGYLLRYDTDINANGIIGNTSHVYSQVDLTESFLLKQSYTAVYHSNHKIINYIDFGNATVKGNTTSYLSLQILENRTYNLSRGQSISVTPLLFSRSDFNDYSEIIGENITATFISNKTSSEWIVDYRNGTITTETWETCTCALESYLYVFYSDDIKTIAWINPDGFPSETSGLQLNQVGSFGKELLEFHYIQPQQAIDPTKTETPYWWPSIIVLALIPILVRKRS